MAGHKSVQRKGRKGTQRRINLFATEYTEIKPENSANVLTPLRHCVGYSFRVIGPVLPFTQAFSEASLLPLHSGVQVLTLLVMSSAMFFRNLVSEGTIPHEYHLASVANSTLPLSRSVTRCWTSNSIM